MSDVNKLNPNAFISPTNVFPLEALTVSGWYETETSIVRVDNLSDKDENPIPWMLAQGWQIESVVTDRYTRGEEVVRDHSVYSMKRVKFKAKEALDALIKQTTDAYNEGRELNDQRYDDIVAIYNAYLSNTEDSLREQDSGELSYQGIIDQIVAGVKTDYDTHATAASEIVTDYGLAREAEIVAKFRQQREDARQSLIDRNMYNATAWSGIEAGINRNEQMALNDLADRIADRKLNNQHTLYSQKVAVNERVLQAAERFQELRRTGRLSRLEMQGRIVLAMLNFMERREDGYPDISAINNMAVQFGAANATEVEP